MQTFLPIKSLVFTFFIITLIIGLWVYPDFGLGWDEGTQREIGQANVNYITGGDVSNFIQPHVFYGPVYEMFLIVLEEVLGLTEFRQIFLMRHLVNFLLFWVSLLFFYRLGKRLTGSAAFGLLGALMMFLSPVIFNHSFHNTKDLAFLSVFIISLYTLFKFLENRDWKWAVIHGITCGLLVDIRVLGVIVPAFTGLFFCIDILVNYDRTKRFFWKNAVKSLLIFTLVSVVVIIAFWPFLWKNPIHHFYVSFNAMKQYAWDNDVLFNGEMIRSTKLPWYYIPVWMGLTIPIIYLLLFFNGIAFSAIRLLKISTAYIEKRNILILLSFFAIPLLMVIFLKSVLYDSWRQLFFIYVPFLLIALMGLNYLVQILKQINFKWGFSVLFVVIFVSIIDIGYYMVKHHPHQQVFFNRLVRHDMHWVKQQYELDYWGHSYKQGLEWVLLTDASPEIRIYPDYWPGSLNTYFLNDKRLQLVSEKDEADYFLTTYRWHPQEFSEHKKVHSISVEGAAIQSVYRVKE